MVSPRKLIKDIEKLLYNLDTKQFEAKILVMQTLNLSDKDILTGEIEVSEADEKKITELAKKRNSGYPLQYLLGEWEFYGLPIKVGEGVLIPRADTETLCDAVLKYMADAVGIGRQKGFRILDICSGSGCIALALEKRGGAENEVFALEKSPLAVSYLKENLLLNDSKIKLIEDDALSPKTKEHSFDIIVSNPPYLSESDMKCLQKEVSFEPKIALEAGENGYYFYEHITKIWKEKLVKNGMIFYEVGINQSERVKKILHENAFCKVQALRDLNQIERVVMGKADE